MSYQNPAYATPTYVDSPVTGDQQYAINPSSARMIWQDGFIRSRELSDFWTEFQGKGTMSLIQTERDTSKGAGQQITFTTASGLYGEPHYGDQLFETSAHFEDVRTGANALVVDWIRHGIRWTRRTGALMGFKSDFEVLLKELQDGADENTGDWYGRLLSEQIFMMFVASLPTQFPSNFITFGGGLIWDQIVTNAQLLKRLGAYPAIVGTAQAINGERPMKKSLLAYVVVACTDALTSLEEDQEYRDIIKVTKYEAGASYIFSQGYTPVRGHVIKEYLTPIHDGYGALGSPLNPMGQLGVAINGATNIKSGTPLNIIGGSTDYDPNNILIKPQKYFPNYPYRFTAGTLAPAAGNLPAAITPANLPFCVAIVNPSNAATDPNKFGLYQCTTNDGVNLNVTRALVDGSTIAAAASSGGSPALVVSFAITGTSSTGWGSTAGLGSRISGSNVVGLGGLPGWTWDGTKNSNTHPVDAFYYFVGVDAIPLFYSIMLGAGSIRRGYGEVEGERMPGEKEGGFIKESYFVSVFGQNFAVNRKNKLPGAIVFLHQGILIGTGLLPSA